MMSFDRIRIRVPYPSSGVLLVAIHDHRHGDVLLHHDDVLLLLHGDPYHLDLHPGSPQLSRSLQQEVISQEVLLSTWYDSYYE
jgi:hypothetical protein